MPLMSDDLILDGPFFSEVSEKSSYKDTDLFCIKNTVRKLLAHSTEFKSPGMLLGKIQSGKTRSFIGVMGLALDNGYDAVVVLTKSSKALTEQTTKRIIDSFNNASKADKLLAKDIMTIDGKLTGYELSQKLVIVAKKQKDNFTRLLDLFLNDSTRTKKTLIIDDEADYASIGYRREAKDVKAANASMIYISDLRKLITDCSFLQVTATPYSLYLQPEEIIIGGEVFLPYKPSFSELVPVSEDYIGGDVYFRESEEDESISSFFYIPVTLDELEILQEKNGKRFKIEECLRSPGIKRLRQAVVSFITGASIRRLQQSYQKEEVLQKYSFIVHADTTRKAHSWQVEILEELLQQLTQAIANDFDVANELIHESYEDLANSVRRTGQYLPPFDEVKETLHQAVRDEWIMISKVNSDAELENLLDETGQLKLRTPFNIFIGGFALDRGVTINNLIGFYYGRNPKTSQQDTVLQHSRMYGFRDPDDLTVTRFYTEPTIYQRMKDMHEFDSLLREGIEKNEMDKIRFVATDPMGKIRPCGPNKILISKTQQIKPFKRVLPIGFQTERNWKLRTKTEEVDEILKENSVGLEPPKLFNTEFIIQLINILRPSFIFAEKEGYRFDWDEFISIVNHLSSANDENNHQCYLSVARDRRISRIVERGHAKYSDSPDSPRTEGRIAREFAIDYPILFLLRQDGLKEDGWTGLPFYWPILFAQKNIHNTVHSSGTSK